MRGFFLLAVLLFATLPLAAESAEWYRSDSLGRVLSSVENPVPEDEEYLLQRSGDGKTTRDELYRKGELIRTKIVSRLPGNERQEEITEGGERRVTRYRNGLPLHEDIYVDGTADRSFYYRWNNRRLKSLELSSGGMQVYRQEYIRDPAGRLRTLLRFMHDGSVRVLNYGYDPEGLAETWVGDYESGVLTRFAGLDIVSEERFSGTEQVSRIERERQGDLVVEKSYNAADVLVARSTRSADGRLLREISYSDGTVSRDRQFIYTGGQLTESVVREPGRLERRLFRYRGEDLYQEEFRVNRRLVRIVTFNGDERIEEYYRHGTVVVRRRYTGDTLAEEELFEEP